VVLSEVWTYNIVHFKNLFPGYNFYYDLPLTSDVGGIGVHNSLSHCVIGSYHIVSSAECQVENLWLEVTKSSKRYIIGGIYCHPGYRIIDFTQKLHNSLTNVLCHKLPCFIIGDINTDLKKFQFHCDTDAYLDSLIANNFTSVVVTPQESQKSVSV